MKQLLTYTGRLFETCFIKSWWVILFAIFCFIFYEQRMKDIDQEYTKLQEQYVDLERQKKEALVHHEKLMLEVNSQSDPNWVELVLMKGLGLVPEGQIKIYFDPTLSIPNKKVPLHLKGLTPTHE